MEDQGGGEVPPVVLPPQEEEEVRAPIPQHQEMMIQPGYEGYALASRQRGASAARRIGTVRSVFDGFRDFEAETRRMEEHLEVQEEEEVGLPVNRSKKRTLEELFKPPLDLMWQVKSLSCNGCVGESVREKRPSCCSGRLAKCKRQGLLHSPVASRQHPRCQRVPVPGLSLSSLVFDWWTCWLVATSK